MTNLQRHVSGDWTPYRVTWRKKDGTVAVSIWMGRVLDNALKYTDKIIDWEPVNK